MKSSRWILGIAVAVALCLAAPLIASGAMRFDGGFDSSAVSASAPPTSTLTYVPTGGTVGDWSKGSVNATVSGDATVTVVKNTTTTLTADTTTTVEFTLLASENGTTTIKHWISDEGEGTAATGYIKIDNLAPSTLNSSSTVLPGLLGWARSGTVTMTLTPTDAHSGVDKTWYQIGAGAVTTYTVPFPVTGGGTTAVKIWSRDLAENYETTYTATVKIDTSLPTVSSNATTTTAAPTTVTITAADTVSGVGHVEYKLDGNATVTAPAGATTVLVPVPTAGSHTLTYRVFDVAGNVSATSVDTFATGDGVPPTTTISALPAVWVNSNVTFTLSAVDTGGSGVATTYYGLNAPATLTYTVGVTVSSEGTTTINYRSVDTSGNAEATKTATVRIDKTAPTASSQLTYTSLTDSAIRLSWSAATDTLSGVSYYEVRDGASVVGTTTSLSFLKTGLVGGSTHTFSVVTVDAAGNSSTATQLVIMIPSSAATQFVSVGSSKVATLSVWSEGTTQTVVVTFPSVSVAGTITVVRTSEPPAGPPTGLRFVGIYYDVSFSGSFTGTATVTLPYPPAIPNNRAEDMTILHWVSGAWVNAPTTVNTVNHTVTVQLTSLSPLAFAEPASVNLLATITPRYLRYYTAYNTSSHVNAILRDAAGEALDGYTLLLQRKVGSTWSTVATMSPLGDGAYHGYVKAYNYRKTSARIVLEANPWSYGALSPALTIIPEVKLSTPHPSVSRITHNRRFSVSGSMLPKHSGSGRLYVYKWNGRRYVLVSRYTRAISFNSQGKFKEYLKIPSRGTYSFVASHGADTSTSDHGKSLSPRSHKVVVR